MTSVITSLCLREGKCVEVCPVECIVPGKPESEWPWYFIDPDTCTDCGACIPECPFEAIFPEEEVPQAYQLGADQEAQPFRGERIKGPQVIDLTEDIEPNYAFFRQGPGYNALKK